MPADGQVDVSSTRFVPGEGLVPRASSVCIFAVSMLPPPGMRTAACASPWMRTTADIPDARTSRSAGSEEMGCCLAILVHDSSDFAHSLLTQVAAGTLAGRRTPGELDRLLARLRFASVPGRACVLARASFAILFSRSSRKRCYYRAVGQERLELSTPRLSSVCSNQLSYWPLSGATITDRSLKTE